MYVIVITLSTLFIVQRQLQVRQNLSRYSLIIFLSIEAFKCTKVIKTIKMLQMMPLVLRSLATSVVKSLY